MILPRAIDTMNFGCDTHAELPVDGALAVRLDASGDRTAVTRGSSRPSGGDSPPRPTSEAK